MIIDSLENSKLYEALHPAFKKPSDLSGNFIKTKKRMAVMKLTEMTYMRWYNPTPHCRRISANGKATTNISTSNISSAEKKLSLRAKKYTRIQHRLQR